MAKYAYLISVRDTPAFWVDHDLTSSGDVQSIIDSYLTSGVIVAPDASAPKQIYSMYPADAINNIRVYFPE